MQSRDAVQRLTRRGEGKYQLAKAIGVPVGQQMGTDPTVELLQFLPLALLDEPKCILHMLQ